MAEFHDYEPLAQANTKAPPGGFPELTPGRFYRPIVQELMSAARRFFDDVSGKLVSTGSNGNYAVSPSRSVDLTRGCSVVFRANHTNPNAGCTLSVGSSGQRALTYADGSTIPASTIRSGQMVQAFIDDSGWKMALMPASQYVGSVTGDKISLTGQAPGSVAIYTSGGWIATGAGSTGQFLQGGSSPAFTAPSALPGMVLFACRVTAGTTITNRSGLPYTATISRLGAGRYRLNMSAALPSGYMTLASAYDSDLSTTPLIFFRSRTSTTIEFSRNSRVDGSLSDIINAEAVDIMVV